MPPAMQLPTLHTAFEPQVRDKALPQLPMPASPTLTNPDMVLPSGGMPFASTPPRRSGRPPSPSYLLDDVETPRSSPRAAMGRKDKLGLMSRKMMLLRGRTNSGPFAHHSASPSQTSQDHPSLVASSPTLQDVGNLARRETDLDHLRPPADRRPSGSGSSSSDLSALNGFLAKYTRAGAASDDEAYDTETSTPHKDELASDLEKQRKIQEEEEYNSAILSKRAEQILANAKKRLNVMEGNLRGARDLVAPLTAANLKRATSLGSAYHSPYVRHVDPFGQDYDSQPLPRRQLFAQASSPTMNRDYTGHSRGYSETELPERPYTALDQAPALLSRTSRTPVRAAEPSWIQGLRGTRSYESLSNAGAALTTARSLHARGSPDAYLLEPLQEADEAKRAPSNRNSRIDGHVEASNGLGIYDRPSSQTSSLREQMSSLRGKISDLKERAREESLRRQSASQSKSTSPFNNALVSAPEFFYTSASSYGSPILDTNAGIGYASQTDPEIGPPSPRESPEDAQALPGSRNAFAEQLARNSGVQQAETRGVNGQDHGDLAAKPTPAPHRKTPSGTAIITSAKTRYSHHQYNNSASSQDMPGSFVEDDAFMHMPDPDSGSETPDEGLQASVPGREVGDGNVSAADDAASIYEDAEEEVEADQGAVVAHEDREDAFDYENFFLHSSMAIYGKGRRGSESSETSASSGETARGPRNGFGERETDEEDEGGYEDDYGEDFDQESESFLPPAPETPERLKEIEHALHRRAYSSESFSTLNTFATADETPTSPVEQSLQRIRPTSRSSRPNSRPGTAIKRPVPIRRDSSSERADSGVGLGRRSIGSDGKRPPPSALTPKASIDNGMGTSTPPLSPRAVQDPASVAVNALLDPSGNALGLRNKVVLFSIVESLRKVVHKLQEEDDGQYDSRILRRRLDEAKNILDGRNDSDAQQ